MVDVVDKATRSRMMAAIRRKNTKPEIVVRKALHAAGFRFRLHDKTLPGIPDIVLKRHKTAIFVDGCFWHGHECEQFRWPRTRRKFWRKKIEGNQIRDKIALRGLRKQGWHSIVIWECRLSEASLSKVVAFLLQKKMD